MTLTRPAQELLDRIDGTVLAAAATPCRADGTVDPDALADYARDLAATRIGGFAVWAHTGRAAFLTDAERRLILRTFRQATTDPIIAGITPPREIADAGIDTKIGSMEAGARQAAELGADGLMVFPITELQDSPDRIGRTVEVHQRIAEASGLPLIGFYLHPEAGGFRYDVELLDALLSLDSVLGVKMASLFDAVGTQDAIDAVRRNGRLAITGEDRMFGPSLMWGCRAALVGIAAARADLTVEVLEQWLAGDHTGFVAASTVLDEFAKATFYSPIEGYVQRMLWAAQSEGLIDERAAHDPFGPKPGAAERALVQQFLDAHPHR